MEATYFINNVSKAFIFKDEATNHCFIIRKTFNGTSFHKK